MRVVVHRVELDGAGELLARGREAAGPEVGAGERLAHRALVGLEVAGALERDDRGVGVLGRQQAGALLVRVVGGLASFGARFLATDDVGVDSTSRGVARLNGDACPTLLSLPSASGSRPRYAARPPTSPRSCSPPYDVIEPEARAALLATRPAQRRCA